MAAKTGPVTHLLAQIQENTKLYLDFFSSRSLPEPSYEAGDGLDPTQPLPAEIQEARRAALEATDELHHLLLGPLGVLTDCPADQWLMLGLQYVIHHDVANHVPLDGETSFQAIATASGLNLKDVTRFLRVIIARHVFHEPRKGFVVHTAASRVLVRSPKLQNWIMMIAEEIWPAVTRTVAATAKWPGSEEPHESGYSLANHTDEKPFDLIKRDDARRQRHVDAMSFSHMHPRYSMDHLLEGFDFSSARLVVDVGGSYGQVAIELAKKYPDLEVVVQDLPETVAGLDARVPEELRGRIRGMAHDFLTPQPLKDADVYLLRWVMHDWSDKYCVKILQALVPGLKKGAKVVVNDVCIPEPGQVGIAQDRSLRLMDISMKAFGNARERDAETWAALFEAADPGFHFLGITVPRGAGMAIVQAEWDDDCAGRLNGLAIRTL